MASPRSPKARPSKTSKLRKTSPLALLAAAVKKIRFGIELETCVCFVNPPAPPAVADSLDAHEEFVRRLNACGNAIGETFVDVYETEAPPDYSKWSATIDESVACDLDADDPEFLRFVPAKLAERAGCEYWAEEIVSPVLSLPGGWARFTKVYDTCLMSGAFAYEVNLSQGLHVNVSSPAHVGPERAANIANLLELWWHFEPVVERFVHGSRPASVYATPLRTRFPEKGRLKRALAEFYTEEAFRMPRAAPKYTALSVKRDRVEFRLMEGTVDFHQIYLWTSFLIYLVAAAAVYAAPAEAPGPDLREEFDRLFAYLPRGALYGCAAPADIRRHFRAAFLKTLAQTPATQ